MKRKGALTVRGTFPECRHRDLRGEKVDPKVFLFSFRSYRRGPEYIELNMYSQVFGQSLKTPGIASGKRRSVLISRTSKNLPKASFLPMRAQLSRASLALDSTPPTPPSQTVHTAHSSSNTTYRSQTSPAISPRPSAQLSTAYYSP